MLETAISIGGEASGRRRDWLDKVELVREAERMGVHKVWSAEAWGQDAVAPLGYLAAVTERVRLGTHIMQVSARVPAMTAMTAMTLAALSNDRFILGLGVSGPQVVEGLHGVDFAHPLARLREHLEIVRLALAGEKVAYAGAHHVLPLPGGQGKALRMAQPPNPSLPVYLGVIGPRSLELVGEKADGWMAANFIPESSAASFTHLAAGAARAGRSVEEIDVVAGGMVAISDDVESVLGRVRQAIAFEIGAMGSATQNFYRAEYERAGFAEDVGRVKALWFAGERDKAAAAVPAELCCKRHLVGTAAMVRDRIRAFRDAGVTTLQLGSGGSTRQQIDTLAHALDLVGDVNEETTRP